MINFNRKLVIHGAEINALKSRSRLFSTGRIVQSPWSETRHRLYFCGMNESAEPRQVKILFSFHSNLLDKRVVETLWATVVDVDAGHYKIENIPFYVTGVAFGDIVSAKYGAEEESMVFADVVEPSGNSTLQIFMMVENIDKQTIRDELSAMGVDTESFDDRFFVADISGNLDYRPVKAYLDRQQQDGVLDYAESCLSAVHYYE